MFRRVAKIVLIAALMLSIGGHWAIIQTAAWAGMIVKFAKQDSIALAFSKTFDGQHPCKLCKLVDAGTKGTQKQDTKTPEGVKKMDLFSESMATVQPIASILQSWAPVVPSHAKSRTPCPEPQPPRLG